MKKYDTILYINPLILEYDDRNYSTKGPTSHDGGPMGIPGRDDPKMYSSQNFGRIIQSSLSSIGQGYWAEVTDFGKYISVLVGYHNTVSGKSVTKNFLIVFDGKLGDGYVFNTHSRWRSISGLTQATDYIKSSVSNLKNSAS